MTSAGGINSHGGNFSRILLPAGQVGVSLSMMPQRRH